MVMELILNLLEAGKKCEKEKVYRKLELFGVDRVTADVMAAEFYREETK